jgi:hypothetical protein
MRQVLTLALVLACVGALFLACYAPALFLDRQFAYRDAGHYYYPLHERIQSEWNHGRWPLWEPEENAGIPILGNPTAAVLYPGKLIFAVLRYPWAARVYIVGHSALAFLTMLILMRAWGASWIASALAAQAYAFGAPILFQHCNIIYLVGAAWLPLGVHAVDRWIQLGRRWALVELAVVLSMQVLGGDPQAAYLLGLTGIGYALGITWAQSRSNATTAAAAAVDAIRPWLWRVSVFLGLVVWVVVTLFLAVWLPRWRTSEVPGLPLPWSPWIPLVVAGGWALFALGLLVQWRGRPWRHPLGARWLGLAGAAALAIVLTAAQLLPVIEFTQQSGRAESEGPAAMYQFSLEPFRVVELAWPNILGVPLQGKSHWGDVIPMPGGRPRAWVPSLYLGGLTLGLALCSVAIRRGPPRHVWLTAIAVIGLLGSLGQYSSPIWWARTFAAAPNATTTASWLSGLGPHDPDDTMPIRLDGRLRDGDGGVYWWLATVSPGFRQFRYPGKLFTFTAFGMAALAGLGWDRLLAARARGIATVFFVLLFMTVAMLAGVFWQRHAILGALKAGASPSVYGPFEPAAGYQAMLSSLAHASVILGLGLGLTMLARRHPQLAGSTALIVMTADLAVANAGYVTTVPQSLFETKPEALTIIEAVERAEPSPGPFRIHRMPLWSPKGWITTPSQDRLLDFASWERETLQPKHGINLGVEFTNTDSFDQISEFSGYFPFFPARVRDRKLAQSLGIDVGDEVIYYPRRAYDLWNARYFVVPYFANGWRDITRGSAAFMFRSVQVYPDPDRFTGPNGNEETDNWIDTRDFRIMRNLQAYPRAWIVHGARRAVPRTRNLQAAVETVKEILYGGDGIWNDPGRPVYDPRSVAWVSTDDWAKVRPLLRGQATQPSETVNVAYPSPQKCVLDVNLDFPGLVILADAYYPGWNLAIDGQPASVYRVNGLMRGAAVPAGRHRLVYTYAPASFRIGRLVSLAGLAALVVLGLACAMVPVDRAVTRAGPSPPRDVFPTR